MIITIDGPTASGKSRAARTVAQRLGIYYLSTGYLYRAVAYCALQRGAVLSETTPLSPEIIAFCADPKRLEYRYHNGQAQILFDTQDITPALKTPDVDRGASIVSAQPAVRAALIDVQRHLADHADIVADGRDCGTVVFPHASHKFFLTADLAERARRWQKDLGARGIMCTREEAIAALTERDTRDATRTASPLVIPAGAFVIDTTERSPGEVVDAILQKIKKTCSP